MRAKDKDSKWILSRKKRRICPECESEPIILGADDSFVLWLKCPKCGLEFTSQDGKVVEE